MPSWSLTNRFGIQYGDGWWAGHTNDVLEVGPLEVLAAHETSGVWRLAQKGTSKVGLPLSHDWESAAARSLARGTRGRSHFYCAGVVLSGYDTVGGFLYETDVSRPSPLRYPWLPINLGPDPAVPEVGAIRKVAVYPDASVVVVGASNGFFSATIAADPSGYPAERCCDNGAHFSSRKMVVQTFAQVKSNHH